MMSKNIEILKSNSTQCKSKDSKMAEGGRWFLYVLFIPLIFSLNNNENIIFSNLMCIRMKNNSNFSNHLDKFKFVQVRELYTDRKE